MDETREEETSQTENTPVPKVEEKVQIKETLTEVKHTDKEDKVIIEKKEVKPEELGEPKAQNQNGLTYNGGFPPLAKYKIVFLGDLGVGKTSIITRFMFDSFENDYVATIGIDFLSKTLHLEDSTIRLQLWDTAGQERFRTLIPAYIRDSSVAVIVYDVTKKESLESCEKWVEDARNERNNDILIMIVGNKCDVEESEREVTTAEGEELAKRKNTLFIEVSALQGFNVKALFNRVAGELPGKEVSVSPQLTQPTESLNLTPTTPEEASCNC